MAETLNKLHIRVGVISGRNALPPTLEAELTNALKRIDLNHPGRRIVLHHGCGTDADEAADRVAKDLRWQVAAHPVLCASGGSYRLPASIMRGLTMLFPPKPARERDAHIIEQSDFIVAVQLTGEQTIALLSRAKAAGSRVVYLGRTSRRQIASPTRSVLRQQPGPARRAVAERAQNPGVPLQQARSAAAKPVPEATLTAAEAISLPGAKDTSVHVGVISGGLSIKEAQAADLSSRLKEILVPKGGKLILHHGCASGADTAAHETVRAIKGGEIHGHPASDSTSGQPSAGMLGQLHKVHIAKPRDKRDADIVRASSIVIFVEPGPPGAKALRAAAAAGGKVINVPTPAREKRKNIKKSHSGLARAGRVPRSYGAQPASFTDDESWHKTSCKPSTWRLGKSPGSYR